MIKNVAKMRILNDLIYSLNGTILENDFKNINEQLPLLEQCDFFDEDMLLIKFKHNLLLDISWHEPTKSFFVSVIHKRNWEKPLLTIKTDNIDGLNIAIKKAGDLIISMQRQIMTRILETSSNNEEIIAQFPPLRKEIDTLLTKIKAQNTVREASYYFNILSEIQGVVTGLIFKNKIDLSSDLWKFFKDFDRVDDQEQKQYLFNQIKNDQYSLDHIEKES